MFPQAELENYKLQVELLQEKLQRSEDNRQQLEHKLDKVLQKRSELEKTARHKTRQKYQEFLEEQAKRNERNKKLVHMLERVDEQTAAMSQRSERLKMMKLQYQMYFAKLVQNQTLRCIQQTTPLQGAATAMPVPVLLPQQAATTQSITTAQMQPSLNQTTEPVMAAAAPQQWTFAMATPTQAGMLLATPRPASAADFMHFSAPVTAQSQQQQQQQMLYMPSELLYAAAQTPSNTNLYDLRATLRALDNENADLPERITLPDGRSRRYRSESTGNDYDNMAHFDAATLLTGEYQRPASNSSRGPTTTNDTTSVEVLDAALPKDKSLHELSRTSSTLAASSLTFDKLPKMAPTTTTTTLTELPDIGQPQMAALRRSSSSFGQNGSMVLPNSRVDKAEQEKLSSVAVNNESQQQQQPLEQQNFEAYFSEQLKIDEPATTKSTARLQQPTQPIHTTKDRQELNARKTEPKKGGILGISDDDLLDEVKASRAALQRAAAAVDEQLARSNQLSPQRDGDTYTTLATSKPSVSLENIENAIYGERLTTAAAEAAAAVSAETAVEPTQTLSSIEQAAHGLFGNLVTTEEQESTATTHMDAPQADIDYGQYDMANSAANVEATQQQQEQEPIYTEIGNPTDYQPYASEPNEQEQQQQQQQDLQQQQQQDYSNIDYSNYDATQYAGGYDPNAYPGYIYDEATGQYIADPNATQYAADGSVYTAQDYDAAAENYDYAAAGSYGEQQPAEVELLQQTDATEGTLGAVQEVEPAMDSQSALDGTAAAVVADPPTITAKPVKPTSILASTDKQTVPNDAQQQQQKKKKRVNFVDSSETDDSSSAKPAQGGNTAATAAAAAGAGTVAGSMPAMGVSGAGNDSDFDFSTGSEAMN